MYNMSRRPRRNRKSSAIRAMVQETNVSINDFIYPLFLIECSDKKEEISSMPGIYRYSLENAIWKSSPVPIEPEIEVFQENLVLQFEEPN